MVLIIFVSYFFLIIFGFFYLFLFIINGFRFVMIRKFLDSKDGFWLEKKDYILVYLILILYDKIYM